MNPEQLRKRYGEIVERMEALADLAKKESRGLHEDEGKEFDTLETEVKQVKRNLERAEALEREKEERNKATTKPITDIKVTRNEGEDENGNCVVWRSLGEQLLAVAQVGKHPNTSIAEARKLEQSNTILRAAASGMSESVMADGGYLVQTDYSTKLMERAYETGKLVSRVPKYPLSTGANSVNLPMVDETSRAEGSRYGGLRTYWEDEADKYTASKPKFATAGLKLKKLTGMVYMTDELLEDAPLVQAWVEKKFPEEFGFKLDDAILWGNGAGQPLGIFRSNAFVTVNKETGQAAASLLGQNIANIYARFYEPSLDNAVWVYNPGIKAALMTLPLTLGSNTFPALLPGGSMAGSSRIPTILGIPALALEQMEALGTLGDIALLDLSEYMMIEKGAIKTASSIHVRFEYGEQAFRFTKRVDGQPGWKSPLTPYKGSGTISPFVTLQART